MSDSPVSLQFHDTVWFAGQIDVSEDWVRRNIKALPHHKVGRLTKFDDHCVELFRDRTAVHQGALTRTPTSRSRKHR